MANKKNKQKHSKSKIFFLAVLIVVVIIGTAYFLLINPKANRLSDLKFDLELKTKDQKLKNEQLEELRVLRKTYQEIDSKDLERLDSILPAQKDVPNIIMQIKSVVERNGFLLTSFDLADASDGNKKEDKNENLGILNIKMKMDGGDYLRFKELLSDLENSAPLIDVVSINFPPTINSFNLELRTYYFISDPLKSL